MIHPESNRIVYTLSQCITEETSNIYKKANFLTVMDLCEDGSTCIELASKEISQVIVKAISLGKKTYLAMTDNGKLFCFWLDEEKHCKAA